MNENIESSPFPTALSRTLKTAIAANVIVHFPTR